MITYIFSSFDKDIRFIEVANYFKNDMVLYKNRLFKYYAKDPRELERLRNDFKGSDIILDTMNKIPPLSSL